MLGCPMNGAIEVTNHTGEEVRLKLKQREVTLADGAHVWFGAAEGGIPFSDLSYATVPGPKNANSPMLVIERHGESLTYPLLGYDMPASFALVNGETSYVRFQLEKDGRLYVLEPGEHPVGSPPPQPEGMPADPLEWRH